MSFQPRALAILLALGLAALAGRAGWADEAPRLRVVPDQIALQPGLLSQDIVITFEPSKARVLDAQLKWFDTPGASVKLKSGPEPKPPTASDLAWTLNVAAGAQASKEAVLIFLLTYQLEPGAGAPARSAIATITAKVAYSGLTLQQSVKVTAVKGFDTLVAGKPKPAVLLVENSGLDEIFSTRSTGGRRST